MKLATAAALSLAVAVLVAFLVGGLALVHSSTYPITLLSAFQSSQRSIGSNSNSGGAGRQLPLTCLMVSHKEKACFREQRGVPLYGKVLPLLLGIGPAKTSSTVLFDLLQTHSAVAVGNSTPKCCTSELYFFQQRFQRNSSGSTMVQHFKVFKPQAIWAAEKTPAYFDNPMVPLRVKALFGSNVHLLLTHREPVSALVSLFFYRDSRSNLTMPWIKRGKSKVDAFVDWVGDHLNDH
jgi:hypothetical protein